MWYGTKELLRQLKINRFLSNVKGEIHFRHRLMAGDSGIVNLYKNYYGSSNSGVVSNPDKNKNPGIINDNDNSTDNKNPSPNNLYSDISGNWAEKYINELSKEGIITGR